VTLASVIEKETGQADERPLISGVFHNRLRLGMPLQSDPTVLYGREGTDRRIRKKDLRRRTSHNTYTMVGLPPTPIANPGRAALEAAVDPAPVDYLYFVARGDGSHQFSNSLAAHNAAVPPTTTWPFAVERTEQLYRRAAALAGRLPVLELDAVS